MYFIDCTPRIQNITLRNIQTVSNKITPVVSVIKDNT